MTESVLGSSHTAGPSGIVQENTQNMAAATRKQMHGVSQENGYILRTQLIFLPRKEKRSSCQTATFPLLLFCFKYQVYHALQYILLIHAILLII